MPTVPYQPYADVKPTESSGASSIRIDSPAGAFGATVGQALGTLGKQFEHTGDELFARAVEIQNLQNETDAKEADAKYMIEAGKLHADYKATLGRDAVSGNKKYNQDLQELRTNIRNGLSNPMAQKLYDGSSLSTMGRTIFNGAEHAANQQRKLSIDTSGSRVDVMINEMYQNPGDENFAKSTLGAIESEMKDQGALRGWDVVQTKDATDKVISRAISHRITGLAKEDPWEAERMMEANKSRIHWQDMERVENTVRTQIRTVGTRNIADEIVQREQGKESPMSLEDQVKEGREKAEALAPKDKLLPSYVEDAIIGRNNKQRAIKVDAERENYNIVLEGISGQRSKDGFKPTSADELVLTDPAVAAAWDALPEAKRKSANALMAQTRRNDFINSPEREQNFRRLIGMSGSNREEFLDVDLAKEDLTETQRTQIMKLQQKVKVKAEDDPRVSRAMDILKPMLQSQGITQKDDSTRYNYFRGSMQVIIEEYVRDNGKQPKSEEIRQIGARLMQEQADPNKWTFGVLNRTSPVFEQQASDAEIEKIKADPMFSQPGMAPPTDEQIRQEVVRRMYNKLYSKPPKKDESRVPSLNPITGRPTWMDPVK